MKKAGHDKAAPKSVIHHLKHLHHSPIFWIGAVLFLLAIGLYIFSEDLSSSIHLS